MNATPGCAYCSRQLPLKQSHILPRWIIERALAKSVTGRMRDADAINKPVQDGEKLPLLCGDCERMFGDLESEQARRYDAGAIAPGEAYGPNFCEFVTSILWRVGVSRLEQLRSGYPQFEVSLTSAVRTWKDFLEGNRSDVGAHPAYFLFLDRDTAIKVFNYREEGLPDARPAPVLHRYLMNSINTELAIYAIDGFAIAWAMGNAWLMAGAIQVPTDSKGPTAIDVSCAGGVFPTGNFDVPPIVLATLRRQSWEYLGKNQQISNRQRERARELAASRGAQLTDHSQQMARDADIQMFGTSANIELADQAGEA